MNQEAQKVLDGITAKGVHELTDSDKEFLKARQSYLSEEHRVKFEVILQDAAEAGLEVPEPEIGEPEPLSETATPRTKKIKK